MFSRKKSKAANSSQGRAERSVDNSAALHRAVSWILHEDSFANLQLHGNVKWLSRNLVILAVVTAWSEAGRLRDAFSQAAQLSQSLFGVLAINTFQGMMRALVTYGQQLVPCMWLRLQMLMSQVSPEHFRIGRWVPLAVDGSRFTAPRTRSNEHAFSAKNYGKGKDARSRIHWKNKKKRSKKLSAPVKPQIWLTLIWHMGLKLPWCWKKGPSTSSERHHFIEMLTAQEFPENSLFCGDAGFIGYELWTTLASRGHSFLIRVGANVRLLKNLGNVKRGDGIVCVWPNDAIKRNQPPIVLRLIEVQGPRGRMYLVTNVLEEHLLSDRLLKRLYPLRWGIELQFRTAKQTFGKGKLRSRNSDHALAELDWSLIALTMIQLLAIREQTQIAIPPERSSVAQAIKAIRHAIQNWKQTVSKDQSLKTQLREATKDTYVRTKSKQARYHPDIKSKPSATKPIIINANASQKAAFRALMRAA